MQLPGAPPGEKTQGQGRKGTLNCHPETAILLNDEDQDTTEENEKGVRETETDREGQRGRESTCKYAGMCVF